MVKGRLMYGDTAKVEGYGQWVLFVFVRILGNSEGGSVEVDLKGRVAWCKVDLCGLVCGECEKGFCGDGAVSVMPYVQSTLNINTFNIYN